MTTPRISILELRSVRGTGGGPEKTILLGAERRDRSSFDVTVCYIRDVRDDVFAVQTRARDLDIDYVEMQERGSFDPRIWRDLVALVRERRIDVVQSHDYKTNLLAYGLARRTAALALATAHGWTGHSTRERLLYYPADKRLLARFDCVIAVSTEIKQELIRCGGAEERITVILNAIDPVSFRRVDTRRETARRLLGFGPEHFVIGAVGRLERQKRFDLLLDAIVPVVGAAPHTRLVIAGGGSLSAELQQQAESLGVSAVCRLLGHRDDVSDLYQAFDVFVQSSEYEGTPNAVLEAMALETPIVATDVGGTAELAFPGAHALIVPARDVSALSQAIGAILQHPAAARMRAAAARTRVETDLSFDARTRRLEAIYSKMVQDRDGARVIPLSSPFDA